MKPFDLRDYQRSLFERSETLLAADGVPLGVLATGGGKSLIATEHARAALKRGERVVMCAHRREIVRALVKACERQLQGVEMEVVQAGSKPQWGSPLTILMVPTVARRIKQLETFRRNTGDRVFLLMDEAHHLQSSQTWQKVRDALAPRRWLGMTATPITPTGYGLGTVGFTEIVEGPQVRELIDRGCLADYEAKSAERIAKVKDYKGERTWTTRELEQSFQGISGDLVPDWKRFNPDGRPTIAVAVSVDAAHAMAELYCREGVRAAAVDGKMTDAQRDDIFGAYEAGDLSVIISCALIDEGLDIPEACVLQNTKTTKSLRLWRQLCGRVLRPKADGGKAVIIDHTKTLTTLPPPCADIEWSLNGKEKAKVKGVGKGDLVPRRDPVTGGVTWESDGRELEDITAELQRQALKEARKALKVQELLPVVNGVFRPEALKVDTVRQLLELAEKHWERTDEELWLLQAALKLPPGWARQKIESKARLPGWAREAIKARIAAKASSR